MNSSELKDQEQTANSPGRKYLFHPRQTVNFNQSQGALDETYSIN